jgi:voltage-gated potassium channel
LNNISGDPVGRTFTVFLIALICLNVTVAILDTVQELSQFSELFYWIELISLIIFTVEYGLRVWSCTADERYHHPTIGRLLYLITPFALIDFIAIFPTYIALYAGVSAVDFLILRSVRLTRVFRVFKVGRYNDAFETVERVVYARRNELFLVYFLGGIVILMAASLMYLVEFRNPSGNFDSIPKTMYWAIITLTTVGYGDVVPVTALRKVIASVIALTGVAFIALPAGILGAGFIEEFEKMHDSMPTSKKKPSKSFSVADEIRKFVTLREEGHITDEEFNAQKALLLGNLK